MTSGFATIDAEMSFAGSTAYSARTFLMALVWIDGRDISGKQKSNIKLKLGEKAESQTHQCL